MLLDAAPCCATPEWITAIATCVLDVLTLVLGVAAAVAAVYAYQSAQAAIRIADLESKPVLVVTGFQGGNPRSISEYRIIDGDPRMPETLRFRSIQTQEDAALFDGGNPHMSRLVVENPGRSPAVMPVLTLDLVVEFVQEVRGARDLPPAVEARSEMALSSIPAQAAIDLWVSNGLGGAIRLTVRSATHAVSRTQRTNVDVFGDQLVLRG
jgi:hypothetical protein